MALMHATRRRYGRFPTTVYEDNYGYTINFYQPMIDYIDAKRRGTRPSYPHLPWSYERSLSKYRPSNPVRSYTDEEVTRHSRTASAHAYQDLINARIIIRSPFSVAKSADAARVTKHIRPDSVVERTKRRQVEREAELRAQDKLDQQYIARIIDRMGDLKEVQISEDLKRAIRGKSASAISAALLADSEKNIKSAKREEEEIVAQMFSRSSRAVSENRIIHSAHLEFIDERLIDNLDFKVSSSLCNVKRQLTNLNQKTVEMYADSRCVVYFFRFNF